MRPFIRGFISMLPLWLVAAPVAMAYSVAARDAGLSSIEIQLMSAVIYSAPTQIAFVKLRSDGASTLIILMTILFLNIHLIIYGLSLSRRITFSRIEKVTAAFSLTDAVYSISIASRQGDNFRFLLGAEASMFVAWNLFTFVALHSLAINNGIAVFPADLVAPLIFFVLLMSIMKTNLDAVVTTFSIVLCVLFTIVGLGSGVIFAVSMIGPLLGIRLARMWDDA